MLKRWEPIHQSLPDPSTSLRAGLAEREESGPMAETVAGIYERHAPHGWLRVQFDYNEACIADLKATIPPGSRRWIREDRHWLIREQYAEEVRDVLVRHGFLVETDVEAPGPVEAITAASIGNPFDVLLGLPGVTPDMARRMRNLFARSFHPDQGGSVIVMQLLNEAWSRYQHDGAQRQ